jgi:hypothetical protein
MFDNVRREVAAKDIRINNNQIEEQKCTGREE